jgi:hypothetical protein
MPPTVILAKVSPGRSLPATTLGQRGASAHQRLQLPAGLELRQPSKDFASHGFR